MKRLLTFFIVLLPNLVLASTMQAPQIVDKQFVAGKHYIEIPAVQLNQPVIKQLRDKDPDNTIQVVEFFSYGCYWCNRMEQHVNKYKASKAPYVSFHQMPVAFNESWRLYGKAYYVAESLNVLDKIHAPLFKAIHEQGRRIDDLDKMRQFFVSTGIKAEDFDDTYESFSVNRNYKFAQLVAKAYQIKGIPAFVVNGPDKSYITSATYAGSEEDAIKVVKFLAFEEHKRLTTKEHSQ